MAGSALVLGGGGVTGIAWELGMLAGLAEAGLELSTADLVIGTSAGAAVGAQLTSGVPIEDLYAAQLASRGHEIAARFGIRQLARLGWAMVRSRGDARRFRARVGQLALATPTVSEAERLAVIGSRLPAHDWPQRRLQNTAEEAGSGDFVAFDRDSGVGLVEAVAASCAVPGVWPPVTIGGKRYVDGGVRSATNVDLAEGCARVVVLAPVTRSAGPMGRLTDQLAALHRTARVVLVAPDKAARRAFGRNLLDPARRAPAARAGRTQAAAVAAAVAEVWSA
jgi:NTE family protein